VEQSIVNKNGNAEQRDRQTPDKREEKHTTMKRMVTKMFAAVALLGLVSGFMLPSLARAQYNMDWNCFLPSGQYAGTPDIQWGYTPGAAEWACGAWISACGNNGPCTAQPASQWQCLQSGQSKGTVQGLSWGNPPGNPGDAEWACNNWISACGNAPGGCTVQPSTSPHSVVYYPMWSAVSLTKLASTSYTDVILAFLIPTSSSDLTLEVSGSSLKSSYIQTLQQHNKKVLISIGGSTFPSAAYQSYAANVSGLVSQIVTFVNQYNLDGVDIDYEDSCGFTNFYYDNNGNKVSCSQTYDGVKFLVALTNGLAQALPGKIITHAPQTPYWDNTSAYLDNVCTGCNPNSTTAAYTQIWQQAGDNIAWFNNQFYNNGAPYDDNDAHKANWYKQIANIVGSSKLMMGVCLPGACEGSVNSTGDIDTLVSGLKTQFGSGFGVGGFMVWDSDLDSPNWSYASEIAANFPNGLAP